MSDIVLKIVSTPIGNLEDISQRAISFLESCEAIIAEDTRNTQSLLKLLGIDVKGKKLIAFHDHNQEAALRLVKEILQYKNVALVSDAGSPILSDPGFPLVQEVIEQGGKVESLPGPSAVTCALEVSGLAPLPFSFHGFAPRKKEARSKFLQSLESNNTHIIFESPQRVEGLLEELSKAIPEAQVVAVRELTKLYEEVYRFKASDWPKVSENFKAKGEFVVLFRLENKAQNSSSKGQNLSKEIEDLTDKYLSKPSPKALARLLASIKGAKVQDIYDTLNSLSPKN